MTYGAFRLICKKLCPGLDEEILDNWIANRYTEILGKIPWKRLESDVVISCPVSYATGTVTVVQGSATITGVGTSWSTALDGHAIRINNQPEYYQFTDTNGTSAQLDRVYQGPDASALTYRVDQNIFVLPENCRILRGLKPMHLGEKPLDRRTPAELNDISITRNKYGTPTVYAPSWDNFSDPPRMQVELYPIPDVPGPDSFRPAFVADCLLEADVLDGNTTSQGLLPWVKTQALENGVLADFARKMKDYAGAQSYESKFSTLLLDMIRQDSEQRGSRVMKLASRFRRQKPPRWPWGPRHEGWPG